MTRVMHLANSPCRLYGCDCEPPTSEALRQHAYDYGHDRGWEAGRSGHADPMASVLQADYAPRRVLLGFESCYDADVELLRTVDHAIVCGAWHGFFAQGELETLPRPTPSDVLGAYWVEHCAGDPLALLRLSAAQMWRPSIGAARADITSAVEQL